MQQLRPQFPLPPGCPSLTRWRMPRPNLAWPTPPAPARVDRPLDLDTTRYGGVQLWPSNAAIVSTMSRAQDVGVHVHARDDSGKLVVDETHSPVTQPASQSMRRTFGVWRYKEPWRTAYQYCQCHATIATRP